jgi:hypothetical protein
MKGAGSRPSSISREPEEEEKKGSHGGNSEVPLKDQIANRDSRDDHMD